MSGAIDRPIRAFAGAAILAAVLADCSALGSHTYEAREARLNVVPENYRTDILAALHPYLIDPTNVRDATIADPALKPIGPQNRYVVCVRLNAKNSDGRYTGSREMMAVFASGRFDQFIDPASQPGQATVTALVKDTCGSADYKPFPELEVLKR